MVLGSDLRGYLDVDVLGLDVRGLLDSGAGRTVANAEGWEMFKAAGLTLESSAYSHIKVADKRLANVTGEVQVPFNVGGKIRMLRVIIVPQVSCCLILGIDFWRRYHLNPDFVKEECTINIDEVQILEEPPELKLDPLTPEQREELMKIVDYFRPLLEPGKLGCIKGVEHHIDTGDAKPIKTTYYSVNPAVMCEVCKELDHRLENDIVEPADSPWQSPLLILPKKDAGFRWVVDFRRLNKLVKPNSSYPLPKINPLLSNLKGAALLTTIDIKDAYLQILLSPESRAKTAFYIPGKGQFQFKRMPAGLKDAASRWQKTIEQILADIIKEFGHILVYMDDLLIWSPEGKYLQHRELIRRVFQRFVEVGLTINLAKCKFGLRSIKYLGHIIDQYGVRPDPAKITAVVNFPRPKSAYQISQFLGLAGWMRKFIPNFSTIAKPLHEQSVAGKTRPIVWSMEHESAFLLLKERLVSAPVLRNPDFDRRFKVYTDASSVGTGAILVQEFDDGEHAIAYASKLLKGRERNYSATELECLAVLHALEAFRPYLEGYSFDVITDHHSLLWLYKLKNPSGRLARWAMLTSMFDFTIIHRKGAMMKAPDALSRNPPPDDVDCPESTSSAPKDVLEVNVDLIDLDNGDDGDPWYNSLKKKVQEDPDSYSKFALKDGYLMKLISVGPNEPLKWVQLIPSNRRTQVLQEAHDVPTSGHGGWYRTFNRVRRTAYWPGVKNDVKEYVTKCQVCQRVKKDRRQPPGLMGSRKIITQPFEAVSSDLIGPLPRSSQGFTYLSVTTDAFSKYVTLRPLRNKKAKKIAQLLKEDIFLRFGAPRLILVDNGSEYVSAEFKKLCQQFHTQIRYNIPYNPRSNPTERTNQTAETIICCYVQENHRKWDEWIPEIQCALNTSTSHVTGYSPHQIVYGTTMVLDGREHQLDADTPELTVRDAELTAEQEELRQKRIEEIREKLKQAHERNTHRYNLRRRDFHYSTGDMVWRKNFVKSQKALGVSKKLASTHIGPYRVKARLGRVSYMLEDNEGNEDGPWHVDQLKRCIR